MPFRVRERTIAIYIRSCKEEISTRAYSTVAKMWRSAREYVGNRFPEELTACGHKIPRVVHVIHKFLSQKLHVPELRIPRRR